MRTLPLERQVAVAEQREKEQKEYASTSSTSGQRERVLVYSETIE